MNLIFILIYFVLLQDNNTYMYGDIKVYLRNMEIFRTFSFVYNVRGKELNAIRFSGNFLHIH